MESKPVIQFECISKYFGSLTALRDIELDVKAGEIVAVVGHNGSGKSTLLRIVSGLTQPDKGALKIDGRIVQLGSVRAARRCGIELLSQEPALFPHLSVVENICVGTETTVQLLGLRFLRKREMLSRAQNLSKRFGISKHTLTNPVSRLSHGQQALVGFMRSLNGSPRLLALDEPAAALGYGERSTVNRIIANLAMEGTAILLVTHILKDVIDLSHRLAILNEGNLVYFGPTQDFTETEIVRHLVA